MLTSLYKTLFKKQAEQYWSRGRLVQYETSKSETGASGWQCGMQVQCVQHTARRKKIICWPQGQIPNKVWYRSRPGVSGREWPSFRTKCAEYAPSLQSEAAFSCARLFFFLLLLLRSRRKKQHVKDRFRRSDGVIESHAPNRESEDRVFTLWFNLILPLKIYSWMIKKIYNQVGYYIISFEPV